MLDNITVKVPKNENADYDYIAFRLMVITVLKIWGSLEPVKAIDITKTLDQNRQKKHPRYKGWMVSTFLGRSIRKRYLTLR
jgi:hypothetical protein